MLYFHQLSLVLRLKNNIYSSFCQFRIKKNPCPPNLSLTILPFPHPYFSFPPYFSPTSSTCITPLFCSSLLPFYPSSLTPILSFWKLLPLIFFLCSPPLSSSSSSAAILFLSHTLLYFFLNYTFCWQVTFLLVCNLAMWAINTFETSRADAHPTQLNFYGIWAWTIISHVSMPLAIFYRFHVTVCLCEIWKRSYKLKNEF